MKRPSKKREAHALRITTTFLIRLPEPVTGIPSDLPINQPRAFVDWIVAALAGHAAAAAAGKKYGDVKEPIGVLNKWGVSLAFPKKAKVRR